MWNEAHLFIDETGGLSGAAAATEPWIVGGVLLLGPYTEQDDLDLRERLKVATEMVGGTFPEDLHGRNSSIKGKQKSRFLQSIKEAVAALVGSDGRRDVRGVAIRHKKDIYVGWDPLVDERELDNRYRGMLFALIEHLFFVRTERLMLTPGAKLHLHIGSRKFVFPPDEALIRQLLERGYEVNDDRDGMCSIPLIISEDELRAYLTSLCALRWPRLAFELGRVQVSQILYEHPDPERGEAFPPACLYLADLYLGVVKWKAGSEELLRVGLSLHYGPALTAIAEMKAASERQDAPAFGHARATYMRLRGVDFPSESYEQLVQSIIMQAEQSFQSHPEILVRLLEEAHREVDVPGRAQQSLEAAESALRLLEQSGRAGVREKALWFLVQIAAHDHLGNTDRAEQVWSAYQEFMPQLSKLGKEGVEYRVEMGNRWQVSCTDRFLYDDAERALKSLVDKERDISRAYADGVTTWQEYGLGACLGSLGQVYAFRGLEDEGKSDVEEAEKCFREALQQFQDPKDQERQWVYLGHLACDQGQDGLDRFREAAGNLKLGKTALRTDSLDSAYVLALQLKAILLFGSEEESAEVADRLKGTYVDASSPGYAPFHPLGLIQQAVGRNLFKALHGPSAPTAAVQRATAWFDAAAETMENRGPILALLGLVARTRKWTAIAEATGQSTDDELERVMREVRKLLKEHFRRACAPESPEGPAGYLALKMRPPSAPIQDQVAGLLSAIRFNYW